MVNKKYDQKNVIY